jgi:peptide/nickel transport system ATP-binding protein
MSGDPLLAVEDLRTVFETDKETIRAVDGVSFTVDAGEVLGVVGESGAGKSVMARSLMGLVDRPGSVDADSSIRFDGMELAGRDEDGWREVRGSGIAMVFQDPMTSLNPVYTVGNQIKESLRIHQDLRGREATDEAIDLLKSVGIPDPARRLGEYPHEFSGGMRQRAVIATALACDPDLLICDEPTTALDVTIQAQILELLADLQAERDLSIIFITHDMGVIAELADRVAVMYAGELVERAPVVDLFENPKHPYTQGLLDSIPGTNTGTDRLSTIEGSVPIPTASPSHCRFAPRCPKAFEDCERVHPQLVDVGDEDGHEAACLLYPEGSRTDAVDHHRQRAAADDSAARDTPENTTESPTERQ